MAAKKKKTKSTAKTAPRKTAWYKIKRWFHNLGQRRKKFLKRRPHRSFQLTRRRDYKRSLKLPGYWSLTKQVLDILAQNKWLFIKLALAYTVIALLMSSAMSQDSYTQLKGLVDDFNEGDVLGNVLPTLTIFWGVLSSQLASASMTEAGSSQQVFGGLVSLFVWLTTIWLLRQIMAKQKPSLRDGIYLSGGPVMALFILAFVMILQLVPAAIAVIAYGAASASGLFDQTAILMLFGGGAILLIVLSLYWVTSTILASVVITLPGMYPMQALKLAGDLVVGRRIRILLRLLWSLIVVGLIWVIILIPTILIDGALKSAIPALDWLPLVPIIALILMSFSVVVTASYVYVFYRRVVEDDAAPA